MYEDIRFVSAGRFISRNEWIHQARIINSHELIIVLEGELNMAVSEQEFALTTGQVLHIAPGVPHRGTRVNKGQVSYYWVHFTGQAPRIPVFMQQGEPSRTEILCKQLLYYAEMSDYPSECTDCFVRILLMELSVQQQLNRQLNPLCSAVEAWIRGNILRPIKVRDVADYLGFNADYLNRVFRRNHPMGLKAYINTVRCQCIRQDLVSTDLTLKQLAQKYGFKEYKYFLKYFCHHEGVTPSQFRNVYCKTHINWD